MKDFAFVTPKKTSEIEAFNQPMAFLDKQLKFISANSAYLHLANKRKVKGSSFENVHPDGGNTMLARRIRKVLSEKIPAIIEDYNFLLGAWFKVYCTPHENGISLLFIDVTGEKRHEMERAANQELIESMIAGSAAGTALIGLDGRWLYANERCRKILKLTSKDPFPVSHFLNIFSQSSQPSQSDMSTLAALIEGSTDTWEEDREILHADGSTTWVDLRITVSRTRQGRPRFFVVVFDDVRARKEATDSLQFALEAGKLGNWDYDAVENITTRSVRFNKIFGVEEESSPWRYEEFLSHIYRADRPIFAEAFQGSLHSGKDFSIEVRALLPDGKLHWIYLVGRAYFHKGKTVRIAGLASDITAEKQAQETIRKAKIAAEEANLEKSNFLANMSHEIRTPMSAIVGFTELLSGSSVDEKDQQKYLEIIHRSGKNLTEIIDDILDLSKVESGHLDLHNRVVPVSEVVEGVTELLKNKVSSKNLKLFVSYENNVPRRIETDSARLRQILLNVIGNAVKFTSSGSISVSVHTRKHKNQKELAFYVTDTGPGISEEGRERLFRPFSQIDSSVTRKFGGTGLGLALSRQFAIALGGDLVLEKSEEGKGSTFLLTLPYRQIDSDRVEERLERLTTEKAHSVETTLAGTRALLVDDSPENQLLIKVLLEKRGAEVELASDGEAAVEKASSREFDVVLMDMQMPGMDGYEATRRLRAKGFDRPIVALTAHAMRHDRDKCLDAGCTEYLSKPLDSQVLYKVISKLAGPRTQSRII